MSDSKFSLDQKKEIETYLWENMIAKKLTEIKCPVCGGVIRERYVGTGGYFLECSTPDCYHYEARGL